MDAVNPQNPSPTIDGYYANFDNYMLNSTLVRCNHLVTI